MTTVQSDAAPMEMSGEVRSFAPSEVELESSRESFAAAELTAALRSLESLHEHLLKASEDSQTAFLPKLLCRYEVEVIRVRQCLSFVHFHGREHLLRELQLHLDGFRAPAFQNAIAGWIGTPGVEEKWQSVQQHWNQIDRLLTGPSNEAALRQLVQYATPSSRRELSAALPSFPTAQDPRPSPSPLTQERLPGVINFNMAHAGADVQTHQKTSQDVKQELQLAQTIEIANSQEQRFKSLLKDLNSSAAELHANMDQAQNAQQEMLDASQTSKQILTELTAQNEAAQQVTNEIRRDRGLSRSLLTACAALALCLGLPKLSVLLPLLKRVPAIQPHALSLEKSQEARGVCESVCLCRSLRRTDGTALVSNLIRERHMYKLSYESLQEVVEIPHRGNLLHKIAFGILGLGRILKSRMEGLAPPSDGLEERERWVDQRPTPYGPPQWVKSSAL